MIGYCRDVLRQRAGEWNIPDGGDWRVLLSNNYQPNYSTAALFWFQKGAEFPSVVTKIFGTPEIPAREFENLKEVHAMAPALVPRPLHLGRGRDRWMLWMEGMPGRPCQRKDSSPAQLEAAVDALLSIHGSKARKPAQADRHRRMVLEPLHSLEQFGQAAPVRAGCSRLATLCSQEWLGSVPVIPQHGDFCANNLLLYRNQWRFLDWENYGAIDLPFYDLFTFLVSLLRSGGPTPGSWDPSLIAQVGGLIDRYARGLGAEFPDVSRFLPLALANWFHLHWVDGRREFTARTYTMMQHYFEHEDLWEEVFRRR